MKAKKTKTVSNKPVKVPEKKSEEITRWENEGGLVQPTAEFPALKQGELLMPNQIEAANQPVLR